MTTALGNEYTGIHESSVELWGANLSNCCMSKWINIEAYTAWLWDTEWHCHCPYRHLGWPLMAPRQLFMRSCRKIDLIWERRLRAPVRQSGYPCSQCSSEGTGRAVGIRQIFKGEASLLCRERAPDTRKLTDFYFLLSLQLPLHQSLPQHKFFWPGQVKTDHLSSTKFSSYPFSFTVQEQDLKLMLGC